MKRNQSQKRATRADAAIEAVHAVGRGRLAHAAMMARVFERLSEWVNADAALVRRGRYLSTTFLIEVGEVAWLITVHEGA